MESTLDFMIMSLMEHLKYVDIKIKSYWHKPSHRVTNLASLTPEKQMGEVLTFYSDTIEHLWKIAECNSKKTEAEEERVGTMYMGSSWEGTYLPEISEGFDAYVMEEDAQKEFHSTIEAIASDSHDEMADLKSLFKLLYTEKTGYYLITWTDYGLQVKANYEEKRRTEREGINEGNDQEMFCVLDELTEEIEVNGTIIPVLSPSKYRKMVLRMPPASIQGFPVWFRMQDQNSPAITLLFEELKQHGKIKKITVVDAVTSICTTKLTLDHKWIKGKENSSKWLTKDLLSKLQENKTFLVAKSWEKDQENLFCWRISFSIVERQCIKLLPPEPKICLIILKAIRRKFLKEPKGLVTYHLKTILFYRLDKVGRDWKAEERAQNILILLNDLAEALKSKSLPLFFEPELNILGGIEEKSIAELETKTRQILASPGVVLMSGILFQSLDEAHKKENFLKSEKGTHVWFDEKPTEPKLVY